jgi:hypothetical protein
MSTTKLRVATVITRFNGGAGQVALNGALALDPESYERTIVTGGVGIDSRARDTDLEAAVLHGDEAVAAAAAGDLTPEAPAWRSRRCATWSHRSPRVTTSRRCGR